MSDDLETFSVDPARLSAGAWCHRAQKTIGQGDIAASYSAERIGMNQPIRKPFSWKGSLWVCVGMTYLNGTQSAEAYRLVHPQLFNGKPLTYAAKTADADAARADPNGFYHGMTVRHAGQTFVLCGPPVILIPGASEQLDLFGAG
jgi:hypothetical protein